MKINKAKELMKFTYRGGLGEITAGPDLLFEWPDAMSTDMMPQEVQFWNSQNTFAGIDQYTVFTQPLEDFPEVLSVFWLLGGCQCMRN